MTDKVEIMTDVHVHDVRKVLYYTPLLIPGTIVISCNMEEEKGHETF